MNMDLKSLGKLMGAMITALILTACGATDTDDSGGATSDSSMAAGSMGGAVSTGTGGDDGLSSESLAGGEESSMDAAALKTVFYFDFDQAGLSQETRAALDAQAARLRNTSGIVRLEGHADERGTREYNLALAERRAKAVADYLAIQGVDRSRIETISYGEEKPVAFGQNEQSWAMNRRVELK